MDKTIFARRFSQLRSEHQLTLKEAAQALGVTYGAISNWERAYRAPKDSSMYVKIAKLYNVTTDYLLGKVDNKNGKLVKLKDNGDIYELEVNDLHYPGNYTTAEVIAFLKRMEEEGVRLDKL